MVKYLINWTQAPELLGGTESRYLLLQKAFPKAKLISATQLANGSKEIQVQRKAVDDFLKNNTNENDIVIKDAGVGGTKKVPAKTVLIYGNPYRMLMNTFKSHKGFPHWEELVNAQKEDFKYSSKNIANSNCSKYDAELSGCLINEVIPNGVDTDFWKPEPLIKKRIYLWVGSYFKEKGSKIIFNAFNLNGPSLTKVYKEMKTPKEDMLLLYRQAKCLIHPFPVEGNCNAVLEALSCGVPVLTAKSGWFWDKPVHSVGYVCPTRSVDVKESVRLLLTKSFNTRQYLIDNKLTHLDYIDNMRRIVKCLH